MQPATANSQQKKLLASEFSKLASQKQSHCGAAGPSLPALLRTASGLPVPGLHQNPASPKALNAISASAGCPLASASSALISTE